MECPAAYNAATESQRGNVIPVEISVYEDRSFIVRAEDPARRRCCSAAGAEGFRRAAQDRRQGDLIR